METITGIQQIKIIENNLTTKNKQITQMKRILFSLLAVSASFTFVAAQTIEEGVQAVYYSKFNTANNTFKQIVAKEPGNTKAIYWLGQTLIQNIALADGAQQARALYQQALATNPNDPWLLVGMGNTDYLVANDKNAARQKFEQAIKIVEDKSKRREKNQNLADIYTAIGRASSQGDGEQGDPAYVIPLLEQALQLDPKNSDAGVYLGMNYLKQGGENGGKAYQAYNTALTRNPSYALAPYRIGVMYQSQGNYTAMNEWFQKAIQADPTFAAPYLTYFEYFRENDVNKAKEFLDQFVNVAEPSCHTKYFQADFSYVSGNYQEAINQAQQMLNSAECRTYADAYLLAGKGYHRLGDHDKAAAAVNDFFKAAPASAIHNADYASAGYIMKEVPGQEAQAVTYLKKAYELDTVAFNREKYVDSIAYAYDKVNKPTEKLDWMKSIFAGQKELTDKNLVALADASFKAEDYQLSDSLYTILRGKYPDDQFAYYYLQQSALAQDTTKEMAVPHIQNFITFLEKNPEENKNSLIYEYSLLGDYYANTKKDYAQAKTYFQKMYDLDPSNQDIKNVLDQLERILNR